MAFKAHLSLLTFVLIVPVAWASIDIRKLRDQVTDQANKMSQLAARIKDFDVRIGSTNNSFLKKNRDIEVLEKDLVSLKKTLKTSAQMISQEQKQVQLAFDLYLLELSEVEHEKNLSKTTLRLELFQKKLNTLKKAQAQSTKQLNKLNSYQQKLANRKKEEQEIYALIIELENRKKDMSQQYVSELEKKNRWQSKLDKTLARSKVYQKRKRKKTHKVDFKFLLPLSDFVMAKRKKNGVTLKYAETVPVKSPGGGRVVYVGELASYGKVIIIDHGKDVRSVLFGDIVAKVHKNNFVKQGQLLGYTMGDPGTVKSVYYEVRKKNIVQNTLLWLDSNQRRSIKI